MTYTVMSRLSTSHRGHLERVGGTLTPEAPSSGLMPSGSPVFPYPSPAPARSCSGHADPLDTCNQDKSGPLHHAGLWGVSTTWYRAPCSLGGEGRPVRMPSRPLFVEVCQ